VALTGLRGFTNERSDFLSARLPVIEMGSGAEAVLPRFADGAGWSSEIVLLNPTSRPIAGTLEFPGATVTIGEATSSSFAYSIPAGASQKFVTAGSNGFLRSGTIRVVPADGEAPTALNIFSFKDNGVTAITGTDPAPQ
jgi:hypothetical protein